MWRVTRYRLVLSGYSPHKVEEVLPRTIHALDELSSQPLGWYLPDLPGRTIPTRPDEWLDVAAEYRKHSSVGALDMMLDSPLGLAISFGVDAPLVVRDFDVLSIGLETKHLEGEQALFTFEGVHALFEKSIEIFQPFRARVYDKELMLTDVMTRIFHSIDRKKAPDTIHWFNYFDDEMVERLGGKQKLLDAPAYEVKEWHSPPGVIVVLQREPFDFHNPEHRRRQAAIVRYLDLARLHELYPIMRHVHLADRSLSDPSSSSTSAPSGSGET